jgi:hypothetical protein
MPEELGKKQKKTSDFLTGMKSNPEPTKTNLIRREIATSRRIRTFPCTSAPRRTPTARGNRRIRRRDGVAFESPVIYCSVGKENSTERDVRAPVPP